MNDCMYNKKMSSSGLVAAQKQYLLSAMLLDKKKNYENISKIKNGLNIDNKC